jgi:ribosome modulation factor
MDLSFAKWLLKKENTFHTTRGIPDTDWVSKDDYHPDTPLNGGQYFQNKARLAGYEAREKGIARNQNPFKTPQERKDWFEGWDDHHFLKNPKTFQGDDKDYDAAGAMDYSRFNT